MKNLLQSIFGPQKQAHKPLVDNSRARGGEFMTFFGESVLKSNSTKIISHVISGALAFASLKNFIDDSVAIHWQWLGGVASVILGFISAYFIEKGTSDTLPIWARQIVQWKFDNKEYIFMFLVNTFRVVMFLGLSPITTFMGSKMVASDTSPEFEWTNTEHIDKFEAERADSVSQAYNLRAEENIRAIHAQAEAIKLEYAGQIEIYRDKEKNYLAMDKNVHTWAPGSARAQRSKIKALEAERDQKVAKIEGQAATEALRIDSLLAVKLEAVSSWAAEERGKVKEGDLGRKGKNDMFTGAWGFILPAIGLCAVFLIVLSTFVQEVYRKGARGEADPKGDIIWKPTPSRFLKLAQAVMAVFGHFIDRIVATVETMVPEGDPEPFDMSKLNIGVPKVFKQSVATSGTGKKPPGYMMGGGSTTPGPTPGTTPGTTPSARTGTTPGPTPETVLATGPNTTNTFDPQHIKITQNGDVKIPVWPHVKSDGELKEYDLAAARNMMSAHMTKLNRYRDHLATLNEKLKCTTGKCDTSKLNKKKEAFKNARKNVSYWKDVVTHLAATEKELNLR